MDETELPDELQEALDERLDWIKAVVARGLEHGVLAMRDEVSKLDDETARSILFVLLTHYKREAERMRAALVDDDQVFHEAA